MPSDTPCEADTIEEAASIPKWRPNRLRTAAAVSGLLIVLFVSAKGCIEHDWIPPKQSTSYSIKGVDSRELCVTLLPDRKLLMVYRDPSEKSVEVALAKVRRAVFGKHYVGPLWNLSRDGGNPLGVRWVSAGAKPVLMHLEVINRYHEGFGEPTFPPAGERSQEWVYFLDDEIRFNDMWLQYDPTIVVEPFLRQLKHGNPHD